VAHVAGLPPLDPFYVKKVFVWVPEYIWGDIEWIPCPHCGERAQPDGWNTEPRRVFLEDDVCYMIGYRCDAGANLPRACHRFQ